MPERLPLGDSSVACRDCRFLEVSAVLRVRAGFVVGVLRVRSEPFGGRALSSRGHAFRSCRRRRRSPPEAVRRYRMIMPSEVIAVSPSGADEVSGLTSR